MNYDKVTLEPIGWPVAWGPGQPEATVLATGLDLFVVHPARALRSWGLIRFAGPKRVRYGSPNLEVVDGHPLGSRASPGELYLLHGSSWHQELEAMNSVHSQYDPDHWAHINHYFSFLWDYTFECLAVSVEGETLQMDFSEVLAHAVSRIHVTSRGND